MHLSQWKKIRANKVNFYFQAIIRRQNGMKAKNKLS